MLNDGERVSAWVVGGCLLVLGCQAFASSESDSDRFPIGFPPSPPMSFGPMAPPQSSSEPAPVPGLTPRPRPRGADEDAGIGTAPLPDAAPLTDAGPLHDAAADAG